jgi:hypothetical protein
LGAKDDIKDDYELGMYAEQLFVFQKEGEILSR